MPVKFQSLEEARQRVADYQSPLTEEEIRALFPWFSQLGFYTGCVDRIQMEVALQQIAAVKRFDHASTRLTKAAIFCELRTGRYGDHSDLDRPDEGLTAALNLWA